MFRGPGGWVNIEKWRSPPPPTLDVREGAEIKGYFCSLPFKLTSKQESGEPRLLA